MHAIAITIQFVSGSLTVYGEMQDNATESETRGNCMFSSVQQLYGFAKMPISVVQRR